MTWSGVFPAATTKMMPNGELDLPAMLGMALIVCGVVVIQLFSRSVAH